MQRMEFFVCIPEGKQRLPVRRSSRFQHKNGLRSSSSADFSGTAGKRSKNQEAQSILSGTPTKIPITIRFWGFVVLKIRLVFEWVLRWIVIFLFCEYARSLEVYARRLRTD